MRSPLAAALALLALALPARAERKVPRKLLEMGGAYHGTEIPFHDGAEVLALCGDRLVPARLKVVRVEDPVDEAPGKKTAKMLSVPACPDAKWVFAEVPGLSAGPVRPIAIPSPLVTREGVQLGLGKRTHRLYAKQLEGATQPNPDPAPRIFLDQTLLGLTGRADDEPRLLWAGDLDHDGALDLILDLNGHHNTYVPTLFLSSAGTRGRPAPVARMSISGC